MAELVVEMHVPLTPVAGLDRGAYPYPWIDRIEEFLAELEEDGTVEVPDDGEECPVKLGVWLSNQRARRVALLPEHAARLTGSGI
jgi:hypothetical protein